MPARPLVGRTIFLNNLSKNANSAFLQLAPQPDVINELLVAYVAESTICIFLSFMLR